jgi:glyoxylase-like metal-dependent hydrolase (beta-lactamase superfamily II)
VHALHVDHVGWNTILENGKWAPTFPKARYLIGRREYDFWRDHDDEEQQAMLGDSVKPIFDAGPVQLVEMDHVISSEIRLTPSIGHTPGHVSVMIESEGERAVITGDMADHPARWRTPTGRSPTTPECRHAHSLAPLRRMGRPDDRRHRHPLRGPTADHVVRDGAAFKFAVSSVRY